MMTGGKEEVMMHLDNLINELLAQGIKAEVISVVKNGVECTGLKFQSAVNDRVYPVVYFSDAEPAESIIDRVYEAVYRDRVDIDSSTFTDWNYVRDHVYIGIQRQGKERLVKKEYLNLEIIMRVYLDLDGKGKSGTIKVTEDYVRALGSVTVDDLWRHAIKNSRSLYRIRPMGDILGIDDIGMYVAASDKLIDAASVIYFREYFRGFCQDHGCDSCYILPSSTQEMIVLPHEVCRGVADTQTMANMVMDINASEVDPVIQLDPCCYRYSIETDSIEIAARAKEEY